jgi:hypothetical protein
MNRQLVQVVRVFWLLCLLGTGRTAWAQKQTQAQTQTQTQTQTLSHDDVNLQIYSRSCGEAGEAADTDTLIKADTQTQTHRSREKMECVYLDLTIYNQREDLSVRVESQGLSVCEGAASQFSTEALACTLDPSLLTDGDNQVGVMCHCHRIR